MPRIFCYLLCLIAFMALDVPSALSIPTIADPCDQYDKILTSLPEEKTSGSKTVALDTREPGLTIAFVHARVTSKSLDNPNRETILIERIDSIHPPEAKFLEEKNIKFTHFPRVGVTWCQGARFEQLEVGREYLFLREIAEKDWQFEHGALIYQWNKSTSAFFDGVKRIQQTTKTNPAAIVKTIQHEVRRSPTIGLPLIKLSLGYIPKGYIRRFAYDGFFALDDAQMPADAFSHLDFIDYSTPFNSDDYFDAMRLAIRLKNSDRMYLHLRNIFETVIEAGGDDRGKETEYWEKLILDPAFKTLKSQPKQFSDFIKQWTIYRACGLSEGQEIKANNSAAYKGSTDGIAFVRCKIESGATEIWRSFLPLSPTQKPHLTKLISKAYDLDPVESESKDATLTLASHLKTTRNDCAENCDSTASKKRILTFRFDCQAEHCKLATNCSLKKSETGFMQKFKHRVTNGLSKRILGVDVENEFLGLLYGFSDDLAGFKKMVTEEQQKGYETFLSIGGYEQMYKDVKEVCKF